MFEADVGAASKARVNDDDAAQCPRRGRKIKVETVFCGVQSLQFGDPLDAPMNFSLKQGMRRGGDHP